MSVLKNLQPDGYFIILRKLQRSPTAQETQNRSAIIWPDLPEITD